MWLSYLLAVRYSDGCRLGALILKKRVKQWDTKHFTLVSYRFQFLIHFHFHFHFHSVSRTYKDVRSYTEVKLSCLFKEMQNELAVYWSQGKGGEKLTAEKSGNFIVLTTFDAYQKRQVKILKKLKKRQVTCYIHIKPLSFPFIMIFSSVLFNTIRGLVLDNHGF